jgi:uncharacterized protein (TIGR02186 family)
MRICAAIIIAMAIFFLAPGARAQSPRLLSVDLAEKSIDITTGFDGARLILYGTAREPGDIAVTVQGPSTSLVVRRKDRVLGIWMNRESVKFENVPIYYDLALSRTERDIGSYDMMHRNDIGLDALHFETNDNIDPATVDIFREALIRNRQAQGLFPLEPKPITFLDDHFFRASFYLPSNVPTGLYRVRTFLIRSGEVIDRHVTEIRVAQTGASAEIYLFAQNQSLAYGVIAVLMALLFGWGAHIILRRE